MTVDSSRLETLEIGVLTQRGFGRGQGAPLDLVTKILARTMELTRLPGGAGPSPARLAGVWEVDLIAPVGGAGGRTNLSGAGKVCFEPRPVAGGGGAFRTPISPIPDGRVTLSTEKPPSEHGLGHLADPSREDHSEDEPEGEDPDDDEALEPRALGRPWIAEAWRWLLSDEEGLECAEPAWLDRLAISRLAISSPMMLRPFEGLNKGKPYRDQIKPYNFMLAAHVAPFGQPPGVDPARFRLVAPFEPLASKWITLPWRNLYDRTERTYSITTTSSLGERGEPDEVRVQALRDVLREYRSHPEAKSLGPDERCADGPPEGC